MIDFFLSENFKFLVMKFSIYLNRRVFIMRSDRKKMIKKKKRLEPVYLTTKDVVMHYLRLTEITKHV